MAGLHRRRPSGRLGWWTLGAAIAAFYATEYFLVLRVYDFWDRVPGVMPGRPEWVRQQLWLLSAIPLLGIVTFAIARRGRRVFYAMPAVLLFGLGPAIDSLTWSGVPYPGLFGNLWILGVDAAAPSPPDLGLIWIDGLFKLALILAPATLAAIAGRADRPIAVHPVALMTAGTAAWSVAWMTAQFWAPSGRLEPVGIVVAFAIGVGLGPWRPWWPWLLVGLIAWRLPSVFAQNELPAFVTALAFLLGALVEPISKSLHDRPRTSAIRGLDGSEPLPS